MVFVILKCFVFILIYSTLWFWISVYKNRNDIADIAWGLGYILICSYLYLTQENGSLACLIFALICIWGIRLSIHIFLRNRNKPEDFRYMKWRNEWGDNFLIRSYLQVFLLQGLLLLVVICPVFLVATSPQAEITSFSILGALVWSIGFLFQAVGDYQLAIFLKSKTKGVLQSGLWKYSRHPNYFGEIAMWWGIFICILPLENSLYFIISPVTITYLLVYVSGVPMLENKQKNNPEYQKYAQKTSMLFPWVPK
jgi:steroid 5-alpha reductase family enzyme